MSIRFLHTADLQIGKAFGRFPSDVASKLRDARFETLKRIASLARDRQVDAVLVAGDCFDSLSIPEADVRRFMVNLEPFSGTWILLPGNHDPAIAGSPWTEMRRFSVPANVVIADQPSPISIGTKAVVLPAPLRRRREATDVTEWLDRADTDRGLIRIGLAHGSVRDMLPEGSGAPNPVARDRAERARLDYLALGDWHGRLKISERTWYPGTPEPDRFRPNEPGYVLHVTIDKPDALPSVEAVAVGRYRWIDQRVELTPGGAGEIRDDIRCAIGVPDGEMAHLVVHLQLHGTVDLATHEEVCDVLSELRARVFDLQDDDADVTLEPTSDDLDAIDTAGFVREAVSRLSAQMTGPEAAVARRALALLYGLQHQDRG